MAHQYAPTDYTGKTKVYTCDDGKKCTIRYDVILENITGFNEEFGLGIENEQSFDEVAKFMFDNYPKSGPRKDAVQHYRNLIARYNASLMVATAC